MGKLFGITIESEHFFQQIGELLTHLGQTNVLTLLIGVALLAFLLVLRHFAPRIPAALIVVVLMTIILPSALTLTLIIFCQPITHGRQ